VRTRLLALVALGVLATGCSGSVGHDEIRSAEGSITGLTVSGPVGSPPVVRMAAPLKATGSETVVTGTGPVLVAGQQVVLRGSLFDAKTGKTMVSGYDPHVSPVLARTDEMDVDLAKALVGQRQGSRVVIADGSEVRILDIVAVPPARTLAGATGARMASPPGLPRVVISAGVPSGLDFGVAVQPSNLVVVRLISGRGPPVRDDSLVTLRTISQVWGRRMPFDDTFAKEPVLVPVGLEKMVAAWDRALVGVPRGSRLLVIAPPRLAFGDKGFPGLVPPGATICYVIDVLGVS
jgi:peptidylprolyl isomerase